MTCDEIQSLLTAYADDELDVATSMKIGEHLSQCNECEKQLQGLRAISTAAQNAQLYHTAPAALRDRLRDVIRSEMPGASIGKPSHRPAWRIGWTLSGIAAVLLVALGSVLFLLRPSPVNEQVAEVVGSHIRSLEASHLFDVASSDQHTVKPWFAGKVDFSPPVIDLKPNGFPLIGGRLDYLDGRKVAALVYQRGNHVINVFIWPGQTTALEITKDGFNLVRFPFKGMICWAISDLNATDLSEFTRLFAAQQPASTHP